MRTGRVLRSSRHPHQHLSSREGGLAAHVNRPPFAVIICWSWRLDTLGPVEPLM
jgi:hypothetical protein